MASPTPAPDRPDPDSIAPRAKKQFGEQLDPSPPLAAAASRHKAAPKALFAITALLAVGIFLALRFVAWDEARGVASGEAAERAAQAAQPVPTPTVVPAPDDSARATASSPAAELPPETAAPSSKARAMRVIVTDQDVRPLPGARVDYFAPAGVRSSTTDASGECRVELDPDDQNVQMQVSAPGYLHARGYWGYRPEQQVKLRRTIELSGRVLDEQTHRAVPLATVSWIPECCRSCKPLAVAADGDGRYRIGAVPFDVATLRVEAAGYPMFQRHYELNAAGESLERDLALPRGTAVRGHVVDFTTGVALPGATVSQGATRLVADATGAFEGQLQALSSDSIQLTIESEGRCQLLVRLGADELALGEALEFRLPDSPIVEGVVRDSVGQPVPDARVSVNLDYSAEARANNGTTPPLESPLSALPKTWTLRNSDASRVRTDSRGAFRAVGLVPWAAFHNLIASHDGFNSSQTRIDRLPGPGERLERDVELEPARTDVPGYVHGRVYLNGLPVPANVSWSAGGRSGEALASLIGYSSDKLPPGPVELRALVQGCPGPLEGDTATVEIAAGKSVVHDFDVKVASTTIRGRVQFTRGGPAARASVTLAVPNRSARNVYWMPSRRETRTAEDGSFSLDVPACELELRVTAKLEAGTAIRDGVRPGDSDVQLSIPGSGTLQYRVIDARTSQRLDPRSLLVVALNPAGELIEELSTDGPAADVDGWSPCTLPEGPIEVLVTGGSLGYRSQREATVIVPDAKTKLEIELEPALHVRFRLEPPPDEQWKDHSMFVVEPKHWADVRMSKDGGGNNLDGGTAFPYRSLYERRLVFDPQGVAQLQCLGPGKYRFRILPDDIALDPDSIELESDSDVPIVVHWKR